MVDGVDISEGSFPKKTFRIGGKNEESPNRVKYVAVFAFSFTILLRCSYIGTLNNGTLCVNEIKELRISIFHGIISMEDYMEIICIFNILILC